MESNWALWNLMLLDAWYAYRWAYIVGILVWVIPFVVPRKDNRMSLAGSYCASQFGRALSVPVMAWGICSVLNLHVYLQTLDATPAFYLVSMWWFSGGAGISLGAMVLVGAGVVFLWNRAGVRVNASAVELLPAAVTVSTVFVLSLAMSHIFAVKVFLSCK